jgi:hypothetical protein
MMDVDRVSITVDEYLAHARFHAHENPSGIGAAVVESTVRGGQRTWDCIVTDGREWHYVRVLGTDVGPFPNISPVDVQDGITRFAARWGAPYRIHRVLNANPLHMDRSAKVTD